MEVRRNYVTGILLVVLVIIFISYKRAFVVTQEEAAVEASLEQYSAQPPSSIAETPLENPNTVLLVTESVCPKSVRLGNPGDGGWTFCDTIPASDCIVYSYGISIDYSFDDEMERTYSQCHTHGFDPSVHGMAEKYNSARKTFHLLGLGPNGVYGVGQVPMRWPCTLYLPKGNEEQWTLATVGATMKELKHSKISLLKIDVEGSEWFALIDLLDSGAIAQGAIDQLVIELHFDLTKYRVTEEGANVRIDRVVADDMDYLGILRRLVASGLKMWRWQWNVTNRCCIEASFVYVGK